MLRLIESLGAFALHQTEDLGRLGVFFLHMLRGIVRPPNKFWFTLRQVQFIGAKSIFVIGFTAAFTGMVLALQGYYTLSKFGSEGLIGSAVALSLVRELGPVLSALMITGRAGSAMCAELGIMRIEEQIDALDCMAIDPHSYLVTPKLLGALIAIPLLTAFADVIGIFGGYLVGVDLLGVSSGIYMEGAKASVEWADIYMGIVKSFWFGMLMVWICTYKGYYAGVDAGHFGPEVVGRATTSAVVLSSISILVADYVITSIML